MTDQAARSSYLRALGIDLWVRRPHDTTVRAEATLDSQQRVSTSPPESRIPQEESIPSAPQSSTISADWPAIEAAVKSCVQCGLHKSRKQTVFGVGNRAAEWMVIGEAPGADEDAQGEPFVGRAGQLLNSMLKACGLKREQVFIANILKCRPPQNRDPTPAEVECCIPFLYRQIELVGPKLILCVGRIAAQNLLNTDTPIGKLRGKVHRLGVSQRPVVVTYHPAYLLRSPGEKRRAWDDLVLAMQTAPIGGS
jgi:uracil-DNA glycosylase